MTVTGLHGDVVDYDMKPALSKEQLEASVTLLVEKAGGNTVNAVDCQSRLEGDAGAEASCWVDAGGRARRTVDVKSVRGLLLSYDLVPLMTNSEVETSLLDRLGQQLGRRPDSAACSGNVEGKPGDSTNCLVRSGGVTRTYLVTVTGVEGSKIDFSFQPAP